MANTAITLTSEQGALVPSQPSVPLVAGDTIQFSTSDGSAAYLFFSPDATRALSPEPASPFAIPAGGAKFSFTASRPGAYSVFFEKTADAVPPSFPVAPSELLMLEIDTRNLTFGVFGDNTKGR